MIFCLRPILAVPFLVLFLMPFLLFGLLSAQIFETRLLPEVEARTTTAAMGVQRRINHAVATFGGLQALRDVEPVLDAARSSSTGMTLLALTDPQGKIRYLSADDPKAVSFALSSMIEPLSATFGNRVSSIWQHITGTPLVAPIVLTSRRAENLLITSLPIGRDPQNPVGVLHAGVDIGLVDALKQDIWLDTITLVLATVIVAIELLILIYTICILNPAWRIKFLTSRLTVLDLRFIVISRRGGILNALIRQVNDIITRVAARAQLCPARFPELRLPDGEARPYSIHPPSASYIRLPLFLFFLSEAILRPILPEFLAHFAPPGSDPDFRAGLAMAGFMAASLIAVLIGSIHAERRNPRRVFLMGALSSFLGMVCHLMADDFMAILLARSLTGFGYGLVYAAGQVYIAQHSEPRQRSSGFSLFLAVIVAAEITGPALGGILADRIGQQPVLVSATLAAGVSMLTCLFLISRHPPDLTDPAAEPVPRPVPNGIKSSEQLFGQWSTLKYILRNGRFLVVIICFAIPSKALLTGGLFLLVPLTVVAVGGSVADSARILMGYGTTVLLLVPLLAPIADRFRNYGIFMSTGSIIAGVGFIFPHTWIIFDGNGRNALMAAVLLFGIGQTLSIPTQVSFLMQLLELQVARGGSGPVLGIFRFLERLGSLAGPLIAGGLLLVFPPDVALMWMGLGTLLLASCGICWLMAVGQQNEEDAIHALLVET